MILSFIFLLSFTNAYNILVYSPAFAASHTNFLARIADTLTKAGHNVTFLIPVADDSRRYQLIVKKTNDVIIVEQDEEMKNNSVPVDDDVGKYWTTVTDSSNVETIISVFMDEIKKSCDNFLRNKKTLELLKSRNFDIGIYEPMFVCGLAFMHSLGIEKTIMASSCTLFDGVLAAIGDPAEYSFMPGQSMSTGYRKMQWKLWDEETEIYRKHLGEHSPNWKDLMPTSSVYFTNSVDFLDFPRASFQKTVSIGGIAVDTSFGKLEKNWCNILDRRPYNMLISFGTMIRSLDMPLEWRKGILEAIKSEPNVTFIWKYESDDVTFAEGVENVHFSKWVPQSALLNDPRLTAFMTHGGLGSTNELAHLGKPALMIPVLVDQYRNSHMLSRHGSVKIIERFDLWNSKVVKEAVHSILFDDVYKENAKKLADILKEQPITPQEKVVKYTEFVGKYGPFPNMVPEGRKMGFVQRQMWDVYFLIGLSYLPSVLIGFVVCKYVVRGVATSLKRVKTD